MIVPLRWVPKEEQERLNKKIRELGFDGLVDHFLEKGWSQESAEILAKAMLKSSMSTADHAQLTENLVDSQSDSATNSKEKGR